MPHSILTISYLAITMVRHEGPHSFLTIALPKGLYLAIIMDRHEGPHNVLTIALPRELYLATIMDIYEGSIVPLL
jgi:hypothetical protein